MNLLRSCFPLCIKPKNIDEDDIYLPSPKHTEENLCRELLPYKRLEFNLVLFQSNGAKLRLTCVPDHITGLALKRLFIEHSILKNHLIFFATTTQHLLKRYVLIYTRSNNVMPEKCSLKEAGICNNDEFLLFWRPRKRSRRTYQHEEEVYVTPTQNDIDQATGNMLLIEPELPMYLSRQFHAFGVLEAFGSLILCSARLSAFVIGCGPQAERLIEMLTNQLSYQAKIEENVVQSLVDMGFERSLVVVAVDRNNLEYADALRWLIDQESAVAVPSSVSDCSMITPLSDSRITMSETEKFRNIQSLLKIIEIHCRIKEPPQPQDISFLTSMGFERQKVLCALRIMKNNIPGALEWLCGDREAALLQIKEGLSIDTEIVKFLLSRTKYLLLLSSPTMFMAFLSILDKNMTVKPSNFSEEVSKNIVSLIKMFNKEKGIARSNDGLIYILINVFSENLSNF